jgi:hypothetical protein
MWTNSCHIFDNLNIPSWQNGRENVHNHYIVFLPDLSCVYYKSRIFVHVKRKLNLLNKYSCKSTITDFAEIRSVEGTLVHMGSYNEVNWSFREGRVGQLNVFYTCGHKEHVTAHQCLRQTVVNINVDNCLSTAAVFLDIAKSFDKLIKLNFSFSKVKLGQVFMPKWEQGATRFRPVPRII